MNQPTHLDLFSGIGGFALAAQWTGWQTIAFSEIEPYACKVLKKNWPDIPNLGDIRNVRGIHADLITGGFPCQPYSTAGKRRGSKDDRALWPEMCRVIEDARPSWVLGENVAGIIGVELDGVLADLERIGYACQTLVIPACAVDARHRRMRVWIMAHSERLWRRESPTHSDEAQQSLDTPERKEGAPRTRSSGQTLADASRPCPHGGGSEGTERWTEHTDGCENVSDPARVQSGRKDKRPEWKRTGKSCESIALGDPDEPRTDALAASGGPRRTIGEPSWWFPEPELGRVAHGIPNRSHRLKGLGNAIVPQVAEMILRGMIEIT